MQMPFRNYTVANSSYRYGFNGKENDVETKTQDYGLRIYDPRLGRFLSVDPLSAEYPWNGTYSFAENDVIRSIDLEGAEKHVQTFAYAVSNGQTVSKVISNDYVQPARTTNPYHSLCPSCPITAEEVVADGFQRANILPDNGTFSFFVFAPELNKANYARYEYTDIGGKQQVRYFDAEYVDAMYSYFEKEQQTANKLLNVTSAVLNATASGILLKGELKAASSELTASAGAANALKGSGTVSGVIELNSSIKSNKAFLNGVSSNARDFVYDPTTEKFAMAGNNVKDLKHYGLRKVIGATEENVVGGRIKLGPNGEILTSQWSGTYGGNWTPEIAAKFKEFMKKTTTKEIQHSNSSTFTDGSK